MQNTIVVSRTFFTQECNEAFEELEEGNEDAMKIEFERQVGGRDERRGMGTGRAGTRAGGTAGGQL